MATASGKTHCIICNKEKATLRCGGCLEEFCYKHWEPHRQELNKQLDEIELNRDVFRQSLTQQIEQPNKHILIKQINEWEQNSIKRIKNTAEETRQILLRHTDKYIHQIESKLNKLTNQLRESREEDDFNEISLRQFQEELNRLTKDLIEPSKVAIQEDSTPFINKIFVYTQESTFKPNIQHNTKWIQNGIIVAGGNGAGNSLNQLNEPIGMYIDDDQTIYIADCKNDRVMEWKCGASNGQIVAGGNGKGDAMNQLNFPRDVIIDKERDYLIICDQFNRRVVRWTLRYGTSGQTIISNIDCSRMTIDNNGYIYVSDYKKDEVRRWKMNDTTGTLVAGGNGKGDKLNQLNCPTNIFIDKDHSIYVSDSKNSRVMKWIEGAKEGIVIAGGQRQDDGLSQLSRPEGLFVDQLGSVYVVDCNNHRIIRWCKGITQGDIVIGGNGKGEQANQLSYPTSLSFDQQGNLYVVDCCNYRIQRFNIDQS